MAAEMAVAEPGVGPLLRSWRQRRRLSQLDLALEAGVSARHVSFVETGRARPSPEMVLHLADQLEVPLRDRNALLLAAGYAPAFPERPLDAPEMAPVREAMERVLAAHDPYPAFIVDRQWERILANRGVGLLTEDIAPHLREEPVNVMRVALHPEGVAPRILNLGEWRAHLLERLGRQVALTGDSAVRTLLEELSAYPAPEYDEPHHDLGVFVPLRVRTSEGELEFFSTIATFGTAVDITVAELSIESFFPANEQTREAMRRYVAASAPGTPISPFARPT
jgi:transcriptional regulator with XRE-family HTH domain